MRIAILPGDGIGPEIIAQAKKVLRKLGLPLEMQEAPVGGAGYEASGDPLPAQTLQLAKNADAILFGAVGDARYDKLPRAKRPEQAILGLRKELSLFANLRPAQVHPELASASALKAEVVAGLDILIVRELTGDIYCAIAKARSGASRASPSTRRASVRSACARWTRRTCSRLRSSGARW
jgi:3-isopropylmalate dehydrogenase